ncbi:MAG: patatin-like phospholipase family protein [Saprospiraceae bacterium]
MKHTWILLLALLFFSPCYGQKAGKTARPEIGLVLSGGGAKGLAHIGILKAVDSAGLKIDYLTGTSMGAIVGSLYSIGYSADSIESIARNLDWNVMLSNKTSLRSLIMEEKPEYARYLLELPWENNWFQFSTGVLEAQEMWLKLSELYLPAYEQKDFCNFSIPFQCSGTDVERGAYHVINHGELITAVRASMAIPTVFTSVDVDGRPLVDGGLMRNFPVEDVRELGADYVIGSSVSNGLLPKEKLTDASQILMQLVFLTDGINNQAQVEQCDLYVLHPLEPYSGASFNHAQTIIDIGIDQGRELYPQLVQIKDSLDAIFGPQEQDTNRLPQVDSVYIDSWKVTGLSKTTDAFFIQMMNFKTDRYYTAKELSEKIRQAFGTRYYRRIVYALEKNSEGKTTIVFDVEENPLALAKLGIHYNSFSDFSLITKLSIRDFLLKNSRFLIGANISENFRGGAEYIKFTGYRNRLAFIPSLHYEDFGFTAYTQFEKDGVYRQSALKTDLKMQYSLKRSFSTGAGFSYEWLRYRPSIKSYDDLDGNIQIQSVFLYCKANTLDRVALPRSGLQLEATASSIFQQQSKAGVYRDGEQIGTLESLGLIPSGYGRFTLDLRSYHPINKKATLESHFQTGLLMNYRDNQFNQFVIGGLVSQFRNQISFAGLFEGTVKTNSTAALKLGLRQQIAGAFYLSLGANALAYNFVDRGTTFQKPQWLTGYLTTLSYDSFLGVFDASLMYNDQTEKFGVYFNLGFPF